MRTPSPNATVLELKRFAFENRRRVDVIEWVLKELQKRSSPEAKQFRIELERHLAKIRTVTSLPTTTKTSSTSTSVPRLVRFRSLWNKEQRLSFLAKAVP